MSSKLLEAFLRFIYPPLCLHCASHYPFGYKKLCSPCWELLQISEKASHLSWSSASEALGPSQSLLREAYQALSSPAALASIMLWHWTAIDWDPPRILKALKGKNRKENRLNKALARELKGIATREGSGILWIGGEASPEDVKNQNFEKEKEQTLLFCLRCDLNARPIA